MSVDDNMSEVISTYQSARDRTRGLALSGEQMAALEIEVSSHLDALKSILNPQPPELAQPASQTRKGVSKQ